MQYLIKFLMVVHQSLKEAKYFAGTWHEISILSTLEQPGNVKEILICFSPGGCLDGLHIIIQPWSAILFRGQGLTQPRGPDSAITSASPPQKVTLTDIKLWGHYCNPAINKG